MIFGSFEGRLEGSTTTGFDGSLTLPAESVATTRNTLGVVWWSVAREAVVSESVSTGWFESVTW